MIIERPQLGSYCSIHIDCLGQRADGGLERVGQGTGCIYLKDKQNYLITNWHIVTGRNPTQPGKLLSGWKEQPVALKLHMPKIEDHSFFAALHPVPLYHSGQPLWLEALIDEIWDVVAIPVDFPSDAYVVPIQKCTEPASLSHIAGREVVIIGYPFGRMDTNPFPIWKKAMVASEPSIAINGKPQFFIDTPGRPGMSGSPIFFSGSGISFSRPEGEDRDTALKRLIHEGLNNVRHNVNVLEFAGIYSGSYGTENLDRLGLGFAWPPMIIEAILRERRPGKNAYAPSEGKHIEDDDWQALRWKFVHEMNDEEIKDAENRPGMAMHRQPSLKTPSRP